MCKFKVQWLLVLAGTILACSVSAQTTYSDNFNGAKASLDWIALGDACLTAGTDTGASSEDNPIIPACSSKTDTNGGALPTDAENKGALLLTPAVNSQTGAILSDFTFPMSQGLQVTFTTYTYGSTSNGPPAKLGADGIVFFLTDGTKPVPTDTGATGGAMGYSCSVTNYGGVKKYEGIAHGYLGLGMDEWGNFLNSGDNSHLGVLNTNADGAPDGHGGNSWYNEKNGDPGDSKGREYQPNRIGMRGAGNVNRAGLHALNPDYYPLTGDQHEKVIDVCGTGQYLASDGTNKNLPDYDPIPGAYKALPDGTTKDKDGNVIPAQPIAAVDAKTREEGWPITYKVTISSSGLLNFSYSYDNGDFQPVLTNTNIADINGVPPEKFRFGFSAGTGGQNNIHEITCFKASPLQANSSAGSNTVTGKVEGNTQFFFASYAEDGWWGSLIADPLVYDAENDELGIGSVANWDAKCTLTGGKCATTGDSDDAPAQSPSSRNLVTWDNGSGTDLKWDSLSAAAKAALNKDTNGDTDNKGEARVEWLRGVRTVEQLQNPPGDLRARQYVLGDIINSSPTFVGAPTSGHLPDGFYDLLHRSQTMSENGDKAQKYSAFVSGHAERLNVVYVGSNDGFLHGFRAGKYVSGVFDKDTNDGQEVLGYMPHDVLLDKVVNLADPLYKHDYLVDAAPMAGDVFYNNNWHTWLVGGVGSDGQEIYALDVTDPSDFDSTDVIGDWDSSDPALGHLGNTVGMPIIVRMHNGDWAFIFGSGLHKNNDGSINNDSTAGIYIGLIDPDTGAVSFHFLDTGVGSGTSPDGIAYVSSADLDGDYIADYLYAGDTQGNVWRFDVTGDDPSDWKASTFGNTKATPLFVAKDASGVRQPIATSITILSVHTNNVDRIVLYFGTGQQIPSTSVKGTQYAKGTQTFYGIWDWDMDAWNDMSIPRNHYAALSDAQSITRGTLLQQTVVTQAVGSTGDDDVEGYRTLSTTKEVCWKGGAGAASCSKLNQYGWLFDLPDAGPDTGANAGANEQIIYNPTYVSGAIVVNTAIPPVISAFQCNPGLQTGWTMAFNPATGGGMKDGFFVDAGGSLNGGGDGDATTSGAKLGGTGTVTVITTSNGSTYIGTQRVTGGGTLEKVKDYSGRNPARVSWRELVNQ